MAFKMKGFSPFDKKTDAEKAAKLVEKRKKLRDKKKKREDKGKGTGLIDRRLENVQDKINENPEVKKWKEKGDDKPTPTMRDKPSRKKKDAHLDWMKGEGTGFYGK